MHDECRVDEGTGQYGVSSVERGANPNNPFILFRVGSELSIIVVDLRPVESQHSETEEAPDEECADTPVCRKTSANHLALFGTGTKEKLTEYLD